MRRRRYYKPLAVAMAVLILPAVSRVVPTGAGPFQALAQVGSVCAPIDNAIIRDYCVGTESYAVDLKELESDAVNAYLVLHKLPAADASLIYSHGRTDLRNAVRGTMMSILRGIIQKSPNARTAHERNLYEWLQKIVWANEIALYQNALAQYNSWHADPCRFRLDPVVASTNGLSYDGTFFCGSPLGGLFNGPPVPAASYFRSYGMSRSYGAPAGAHSNFAGLVSGTASNMAEVVGIATSVGAALTIGVSAALAASFSAATAAAAAAAGTTAAATAGLAAYGATFSLSSAAVGALGGVAAATAAVGGIILIGVAIGVAAAIQVFDKQQILDDLSNLQSQLSQATNTPPDLLAFASPSNTLGLYKLQMSLVSKTVPDLSSAAPLPSHQNADLNFSLGPTITAALSFKDWDDNTVTAQTAGAWFVQTCAGAKCAQADSLIATLRYKDWSGAKWMATRVGDRFVSTKNDPAEGDKTCEADAVTGVSPGTDFSTCISYTSHSIQLRDASGNPQTVAFSVLSQPVFTSAAQFAFSPGTPSTQTITFAGNPTPTVCLSGPFPLPADFSFSGDGCGTGSLPLTFNGSLTSPTQAYTLNVIATNSAGSRLQTLTVNVATALNIISPDTMSGTAGTPITFKVVATGIPKPALSIDPQFDLAGLRFTDNGDGTATISGTAFKGGEFTCFTMVDGSLVRCGIKAVNSQGSITQPFTLNLTPAPAAFLAPPTGVTFTAGTGNFVRLSAIGASTPVTWEFLPDPSAPWLNFSSDGLGTILRGYPPAGTTGTFFPTIIPKAFGSFGAAGPYPVTVVNRPVVSSPGAVDFTVGSFGSFAITANAGSVSVSGTLPKGLNFAGGERSATLSGTPAAGTGGQYLLPVRADAGALGTATQALIVNVYEGPKITSPDSASLFTGIPASFAVTTTGFPSVSNKPATANPLPPTSPDQGSGMYFTVSGLPAGLQASNLSPQGFATGTLTIQGTPAAPGEFPVLITAQNGAGTTAQQTLLLKVVSITGPAPANGTSCNGTYNGTFRGDVLLSAGQNCTFVGGGVNGNIEAGGGNLALSNATVSGNIEIRGPAAFTIGRNTTIKGNLSIANVGSASTTSRICGSTVSGNLEVSRNAIPIAIGNSDGSCPGNVFGKNVNVESNTGAIEFHGNSAGKSLSCSGNTSISGAGNTADKKLGQCATF